MKIKVRAFVVYHRAKNHSGLCSAQNGAKTVILRAVVAFSLFLTMYRPNFGIVTVHTVSGCEKASPPLCVTLIRKRLVDLVELFASVSHVVMVSGEKVFEKILRHQRCFCEVTDRRLSVNCVLSQEQKSEAPWLSFHWQRGAQKRTG